MNYVYKFVNYDEVIIYIGKTSNLKNRMKQHFGNHPHLDKECYKQVCKIYYACIPSQYNTELFETYLINKYHPIYNSDKNYVYDNNQIDIKLEEPEWKELYFLKVKTKNHLPNIQFLDSLPYYLDNRLMLQESIKLAFDYNFSKIECYHYEFLHCAPKFMSTIANNFGEVRQIYLYAQKHISINETNMDRVLSLSDEEQVEENFIAFRLDNLQEIVNNIPHFNLFLRYGFITYLASDLFAVHMITPTFLRKVEENYHYINSINDIWNRT